MLLILTGEGPSDIGACKGPIGFCRNGDFQPGPMAVLVDQIVSARLCLNYSVLSDKPDCVFYVDESRLVQKIAKLKQHRKNLFLSGKKKDQETGYYFNNARAFGLIALELEGEADDTGPAVFFRDSDGTRSTPGADWLAKWTSIKQGFLRAENPRGVPMLPKPTSEAWLLCAAQEHSYQNCPRYEELPGNQASPNHPKKALDKAFGAHKNAAELCDWLRENPLDLDRASLMPSFRNFRECLNTVLDQVVPA